MLPLSPPLGKGPKLPRRLFLPLATLPLTLPPPNCDVNVSEQTAVPKQSSRKERFTQMARTTSLPFFLPQQDLRIAARFHAVRWVKLCDATWKGTGASRDASHQRVRSACCWKRDGYIALREAR